MNKLFLALSITIFLSTPISVHSNDDTGVWLAKTFPELRINRINDPEDLTQASWGGQYKSLGGWARQIDYLQMEKRFPSGIQRTRRLVYTAISTNLLR